MTEHSIPPDIVAGPSDEEQDLIRRDNARRRLRFNPVYSTNDKLKVRCKQIYPLVPGETLPDAWSEFDRYPLLQLSCNNCRVNYERASRDNPSGNTNAASVRANRPIPTLCGIYYYEILILRGDKGCLGLGVCTRNVDVNRLPGWDRCSYGYHGDDGNFFSFSGSGVKYGPTFSTGDVIGCGVNLIEKKIFFTKNGMNLGYADAELDPIEGLFPVVGLQARGECIEANFGQEPFEYDILQDIEEVKSRLSEDIRSIVLPQEKIQWMKGLVTSYLETYGFGNTVKALKCENPPTEEDVTTMNTRRDVFNLIVNRDTSNALSFLRYFYPDILIQYPVVHLKLMAQRLIEDAYSLWEMIKKRKEHLASKNIQFCRKCRNKFTTYIKRTECILEEGEVLSSDSDSEVELLTDPSDGESSILHSCRVVKLVPLTKEEEFRKSYCLSCRLNIIQRFIYKKSRDRSTTDESSRVASQSEQQLPTADVTMIDLTVDGTRVFRIGDNSLVDQLMKRMEDYYANLQETPSNPPNEDSSSVTDHNPLENRISEASFAEDAALFTEQIDIIQRKKRKPRRSLHRESQVGSSRNMSHSEDSHQNEPSPQSSSDMLLVESDLQDHHMAEPSQIAASPTSSGSSSCDTPANPEFPFSKFKVSFKIPAAKDGVIFFTEKQLLALKEKLLSVFVLRRFICQLKDVMTMREKLESFIQEEDRMEEKPDEDNEGINSNSKFPPNKEKFKEDRRKKREEWRKMVERRKMRKETKKQVKKNIVFGSDDELDDFPFNVEIHKDGSISLKTDELVPDLMAEVVRGISYVRSTLKKESANNDSDCAFDSSDTDDNSDNTLSSKRKSWLQRVTAGKKNNFSLLDLMSIYVSSEKFIRSNVITNYEYKHMPRKLCVLLRNSPDLQYISPKVKNHTTFSPFERYKLKLKPIKSPHKVGKELINRLRNYKKYITGEDKELSTSRFTEMFKGEVSALFEQAERIAKMALEAKVSRENARFIDEAISLLGKIFDKDFDTLYLKYYHLYCLASEVNIAMIEFLHKDTFSKMDEIRNDWMLRKEDLFSFQVPGVNFVKDVDVVFADGPQFEDSSSENREDPIPRSLEIPKLPHYEFRPHLASKTEVDYDVPVEVIKNKPWTSLEVDERNVKIVEQKKPDGSDNNHLYEAEKEASLNLNPEDLIGYERLQKGFGKVKLSSSVVPIHGTKYAVILSSDPSLAPQLVKFAEPEDEADNEAFYADGENCFVRPETSSGTVKNYEEDRSKVGSRKFHQRYSVIRRRIGEKTSEVSISLGASPKVHSMKFLPVIRPSSDFLYDISQKDMSVGFGTDITTNIYHAILQRRNGQQTGLLYDNLVVMARCQGSLVSRRARKLFTKTVKQYSCCSPEEVVDISVLKECAKLEMKDNPKLNEKEVFMNVVQEYLDLQIRRHMRRFCRAANADTRPISYREVFSRAPENVDRASYDYFGNFFDRKKSYVKDIFNGPKHCKMVFKNPSRNIILSRRQQMYRDRAHFYNLKPAFVNKDGTPVTTKVFDRVKDLGITNYYLIRQTLFHNIRKFLRKNYRFSQNSKRLVQKHKKNGMAAKDALPLLAPFTEIVRLLPFENGQDKEPCVPNVQIVSQELEDLLEQQKSEYQRLQRSDKAVMSRLVKDVRKAYSSEDPELIVKALDKYFRKENCSNLNRKIQPRRRYIKGRDQWKRLSSSDSSSDDDLSLTDSDSDNDITEITNLLRTCRPSVTPDSPLSPTVEAIDDADVPGPSGISDNSREYRHASEPHDFLTWSDSHPKSVSSKKTTDDNISRTKSKSPSTSISSANGTNSKLLKNGNPKLIDSDEPQPSTSTSYKENTKSYLKREAVLEKPSAPSAPETRNGSQCRDSLVNQQRANSVPQIWSIRDLLGESETIQSISQKTPTVDMDLDTIVPSTSNGNSSSSIDRQSSLNDATSSINEREPSTSHVSSIPEPIPSTSTAPRNTNSIRKCFNILDAEERIPSKYLDVQPRQLTDLFGTKSKRVPEKKTTIQLGQHGLNFKVLSGRHKKRKLKGWRRFHNKQKYSPKIKRQHKSIRKKIKTAEEKIPKTKLPFVLNEEERDIQEEEEHQIDPVSYFLFKSVPKSHFKEKGFENYLKTVFESEIYTVVTLKERIADSTGSSKPENADDANMQSIIKKKHLMLLAELRGVGTETRRVLRSYKRRLRYSSSADERDIDHQMDDDLEDCHPEPTTVRWEDIKKSGEDSGEEDIVIDGDVGYDEFSLLYRKERITIPIRRIPKRQRTFIQLFPFKEAYDVNSEL